MIIEGRIEKAKKRVAKALHNITYAADALLKQNVKLEKECLDLNNIQNHMKSSIASLEAENAAILGKLEEIRSKIDNKSQVLQTGLAIEVKSEQQQSSSTVNAESELCTLPKNCLLQFLIVLELTPYSDESTDIGLSSFHNSNTILVFSSQEKTFALIFVISS